MSISAGFIKRPIGTGLLAAGIFMLGTVAYFLLPVASLPSVDFPAVFINLGHGQNGFLTAGLFGAALLALPARPVSSGLPPAARAHRLRRQSHW